MGRVDVSAFAKQVYLQHKTIPVDVVRLAGLLKIDIELTDLGSFSGYYLSAPNGSYMTINQKHTHARRRWTIAHELGHHVINTNGNRLNKSGIIIKYYSSRERLCNQFAAALLMPEDEVRLRIPLYLRQSKEETIREFARQFDVSLEAAKLRLTELGIIERANNADHDELQMIYKAVQTLPEDSRLIATEQLSSFLQETKDININRDSSK